ncbi:MAG TPA: hypothetical protein VGE36_14220 [Roseateles sp.]
MGRPALTAITASAAALAYAACVGLDPEGRATPDSAARAGESFSLETGTGRLACTLIFEGGCCWISAAAGTGTGMALAGLRAIEGAAIAKGCKRVGFQTIRRGLVRRAKSIGYGITRSVGRGVILEKQLA